MLAGVSFGEIDKGPKAGMVECSLAPLTTDVCHAHPFPNAESFVEGEGGQNGEYDD
jgi:hypothetical protein